MRISDWSSDVCSSDLPDAVFAQNGGGQIVNDGLVAIAMRYMFQLGHQLAGALSFGDRQIHIALPLTPGYAFASQLFQAAYAPFITSAARLYTLTYPGFFLRQHFIELGVLLLLCFQPFGLALLPLSEVARKAEELAPVKFDNARCHHIQKAAIMGGIGRASVRARGGQYG